MSVEVITIENFKCFDSLRVPLTRLNVLSGKNGAGKSSFIQALLLLQMASSGMKAGIRDVPLNAAPGLALGTVGDVLRKNVGSPSTDRSDIQIVAEQNGLRSTVVFETKDIEETSNYLTISSTLNSTKSPSESPWNFQFLSAERAGPRLVQERLSNLPLSSLTLGEHGEFSIEVLNRLERYKLRDEVVHPLEHEKESRDRNQLLGRNAELWMSSIFGPMQIRVDSTGVHSPPSLWIREAHAATDWAVATNFGFGISYALPIVVAGLLVEEGATLIVDSPEAHLHPAAQTEIAKFLATVAASGVQVIVETHSDHVVDGFRLAIIDKSVNLANKDCGFLNFARTDDGRCDVRSISIRDDGTLTEWPKGFFDQHRQNLRKLTTPVPQKKSDGEA